MLKDYNLLEIFWDYYIVTIDMSSLGYYPAVGLYSAGQSKRKRQGKYDPAYRNLGKLHPEKWGMRNEKFLPVHY